MTIPRKTAGVVLGAALLATAACIAPAAPEPPAHPPANATRAPAEAVRPAPAAPAAPLAPAADASPELTSGVASGPAPQVPAGSAADLPARALLPLVTDPPARLHALSPTEGGYTIYQGEVCGIVPRPEYGYTVRYPKVWEAREDGPSTWLVDLGNGAPIREHTSAEAAAAAAEADGAPRLVGVVAAAPAPSAMAGAAELERLLTAGWQARGLPDLHLEPAPEAVLAGQPAARVNLRYTGPDATPLAGYATALVAGGVLYRVEIAMPAERYARLARAGDIVAEQLLLTRAP